MSNLSYTILGISLIFIGTTFGSSLVFLFKKEINEKLNSLILGIASGIMLSASIFGLIIPALEEGSFWGDLHFLPATIGIILGMIFLLLIQVIGNKTKEAGLRHKTRNMFIAVTIHNIPEGLAVGAGFGLAYFLNEPSAIIGAFMLAFGITMQNIPEGMAVSVPIAKATKSKFKGFFWGTMSGIVEPIFACIGFFLASKISSIMPWILAFAGGNMLFSIADDLIPESKHGNSHIGAVGFILGFTVMMILDVVL